MVETPEWTIAGTYLESCNCDPICPCRRVGGRPGTRSTHGECKGALSWLVTEGHVGDVDLSGLGAVLAVRYHDDEPGSPWTFMVYVDERGDENQRDALAAIFTGRFAGTQHKHFPWVFKRSNPLGWQAATIEIDHTPGRGWFRVQDNVVLRISGVVADQEPVTCVIPGHHNDGRELHAEHLHVDAEGLSFDFQMACAYESTFAYSSAAA